ncbi:hypothetical protein [Alicyclobacillus fastidiosus]|uniref:CopG family transcriptional regulator n=1 Tax=Alicyclobacillus fastidiosus TaxID=392011 RepID=A0ABV5AJL7_9BACL|nr:hypothetical protein [Alicyclobacillus fastidiosus]WEH11116.1 hypothetical protein PYS47_07830 [Alicyclobacillus fastidiosus]
MAYGEKRRAVSFNLDNPQERAMFEYTKRTNFSKLVKTYLARELKRQQPAQTQPQSSSITVRVGGESR